MSRFIKASDRACAIGEATRVSVTHEQWAEDDTSYTPSADGWPRILFRLKTLIEQVKRLIQTEESHHRCGLSYFFRDEAARIVAASGAIRDGTLFAGQVSEQAISRQRLYIDPIKIAPFLCEDA